MMKVFFKLIILTVSATAMAITLIANSGDESPPPPHPSDVPNYKRPMSRFLQQSKPVPRAADHCNKDNEVCNSISVATGRTLTCCNNKCIDVWYDDKNCGACKKKCASSSLCCNRECVNPAHDKMNCGACNNRCMHGGNCTFGMCDYAM